ncbi:DUF742 domain-containing protein [Planomonospora venezuelensis]|uniref:DUF742 domain-containing protein n=1 Tax=Planomonospora venezuelensis TaxID=1999 RepID=A0A841DJU3_PLAVE|nr:DUF742 domain-containing protein [Planomonospora venezuelensis]MBB5967396.1 hypothetical protein [Planomonospora venezuelensis]GIN05314.1 hypothetical protein Pve01_69720 [Planomonospora venezuelensis]
MSQNWSEDPKQAYGGGRDGVPDDGSDEVSFVRPFAVTGGRTGARVDLALEALVSVTVPEHTLAAHVPEYQAVGRLCWQQVRSIAEISALLGLPLGVARVVIADMASAGLAQIHQTRLPTDEVDVDLLERVLSGLRRL